MGARSSPLSRTQVAEIQEELGKEILLDPIWVQTTGDLDQKTSLRKLDKTDFFTRELDQMLLKGQIDAAIHSAKDLPSPLPQGLKIGALTKGVDPRDSLVLRVGETLSSLKTGSLIGTSSLRREEEVSRLRSDLIFTDLRGTIEERIEKISRGIVDGIVVAEAALIRLKLTHLNRIILNGDTAPLQGRLAVLIRTHDLKLQELFSKIDAS